MKKDNDLLKQIPKLPGVYTYKNKDNEIIYIGKASNLSNRIKSYFNRNNDIKTKTLVRKIEKIEYFVTNNELEALLLENNLIKQFKPKYNIKLKDSKSFPFIKIIKENLPRIILTRENKNNFDEYYGPFVDLQSIRIVLSIFRKYLKIRSCKKKFKPPYKYKPCLNYHIGRCFAPCAGLISDIEYEKNVNTARSILKGKTKELINELTKSMTEYSVNMEYEKAALLRDQINSIKELEKKQLMEGDSKDNSDYIGLYTDFKTASISLLRQRDGKILNKENFIVTNFLDYSTVLSDFLGAYYLNNITEFPKNIFIQEEIENKELLINAINKKFNVSVSIRLPKEEKEKRITLLSKENAEIYFEEKNYKLEKIHHLRELKRVLNLDKLPRRIECFDIATLNGKFSTAAMVSFYDGKPDKKEYRQFNIEGEGHPDDYAMMEEVIARRYQKLKNEKLQFPDLIVVDGGKGQVTSASNSLSILDIDIPVIGLAKKEEYIFLQNSKNPLILSRDSIALKLLQAIRDESHRFSNIRLNKRYKNKNLETALAKIEGVGEKRINLLLKKFKSIDGIKKAPLEQLCEVESIGEDIANKIINYFKEIK